MTRTHGVYLMAGSMVLISVGLGVTVSQWWFLLTAFVGVNLIQSSFTGFCPAEKILAKLGLPEGRACSSR
ncbi:MAG: DUF2892 domain-containing protein [Phycisphaerae bacterium]